MWSTKNLAVLVFACLVKGKSTSSPSADLSPYRNVMDHANRLLSYYCSGVTLSPWVYKIDTPDRCAIGQLSFGLLRVKWINQTLVINRRPFSSSRTRVFTRQGFRLRYKQLTPFSWSALRTAIWAHRSPYAISVCTTLWFWFWTAIEFRRLVVHTPTSVLVPKNMFRIEVLLWLTSMRRINASVQNFMIRVIVPCIL